MESEIPGPVETLIELWKNGHYNGDCAQFEKDLSRARYLNRHRYRFGSGNTWYYPEGLFEKAMEILESRQV